MVRKGLRVEKIIGYRFPGVIRSVFRTGAGRTRCVVECTVPGCEGMLHIFNPDQLREAPPEKKPGRGTTGRQVERDAEPEKSWPVNGQDSTKPPENEKLTLSVKQACARAGISRTRLYRLMDSGEVAARKIGYSTIILRADLDAWVAALPPQRAARSR